MSYYASLDKIASAESALGAPIALEDSLVLKQLVVALGNVTGGGGGGSGTVTSFSFTNGAGITGVVTNPTTTPALALTLGAITPTSVNGLTLTAAAIGFTIAGGTTSKTLTVLGTGTAALLEIAQTFTAANIFSVNGAASTPAVKLTGSILTGGTGTTNFPNFFIQPTGATAATTWSTSGTAIGVNAATGFAGNFADFRVAGASKFSVDTDGNFTAAGGFWQISPSMYFRNSSGSMVWTNSLGAVSAIGLTSAVSSALDAFFTRKAAATLSMGADAAGVTNQMLTAASRITSDGVGANLTIAGGNGRGGAGGTLILSTYDTAGAATIGTLRSRMTFDTAGAIAFPVVTAVTTETVVSDTTWPVTINGVAYKICLKA